MIKLKILREEQNVTQQKIAMDMQLSQASISKYELGIAEPDISTIIKLAAYFNVSTDYFLGVSDSKLSLKKSDLTETEIKHLAIYKSLTKTQMDRVNAYIHGILSAKEL